MRYEGALRSPIYDLCRQTVTVYHACYNPFRVTRCVIHGAYFERKTVQTVDKSGGKSCDEFLLVIPNKNARRVAPALFNGIPGVYVLECGDRLVEGVLYEAEAEGTATYMVVLSLRYTKTYESEDFA